MATREYFGIESITQYDGQDIVQRVVNCLCSGGSDLWAFASLSEALDISAGRLQGEYGTEEALVETAWELWPQIVLAALSDPLRNKGTGREAIQSLLETAISLQDGHRRLKELRNASPGAAKKGRFEEVAPTCGWSLGRQIRERFERSVYEGELAESANVSSLTALCLRLVNGCLVCTEDEKLTPTALDSVKLFVDGLGFQVARLSKRRRRRLTPVLAFVKRSPVL
jgi:hypothetical protein